MRTNKAEKQIRKADHCLDLAKWEEAEDLLKKSIKLDSRNPEAYYLLGEALSKQERFDESIMSLEKADKLAPDNPRILHLLGWNIFMGGNVKLGRQYMIKAHELLPDDTKILCDLAVLENKEHNDLKAKEFALLAMQIDSNDPMVQEVYQAVLSFSKLRSDLLKNNN